MTRSRVNETGWIYKLMMWLLLVIFIIFALPGGMKKVSAANLTKEQEKELRGLFLEMLLTSDKTERDISKYKLDSYVDLKNIFNDMCKNEGALASYCYTFVQVCPVWDKRTIAKARIIYQNPNPDFQKDYATITKNVDDIMSGITDDMTDADKALYLHERIVGMTSYSTDKEIYAYAGGPLIYGYGSCTGYTSAYNYLLSRVGIRAGKASGNKHEWSVIQLDGKWYNVDTTWDHPKSSGIIQHKFFLKSDNEFRNYPVAKDRHLNFTSYDENYNIITADSDAYSDIFIHDLSDVGTLFYEDGLWYYTDKNGEMMAGVLTDKEAHVVNTSIGGSFEVNNQKDEESETPETEESVKETPAKYFLCKGNRTDYSASNYISLGKGSIIKEERVMDDEDTILANLGDIPSYDQYLVENQRICWYSIKKEGDGWHVDGQIITEEKSAEEPVIEDVNEEVVEDSKDVSSTEENNTVEENVENSPLVPDVLNAAPEETPNEPVVNTPEVEKIVETKAMFYLCKGSRIDYRASNYINLGTGTITKTERLLDDEEAIINALGNVPSYDKYLGEDQGVCWYSVKKESDGWHVDGQIITEEKPSEEPVIEDVNEEDKEVVEDNNDDGSTEENAIEEKSEENNTVEETVENSPEVPEVSEETPEETEEIPDEPVVETPEPEKIVETKAMFYLCKGSRTDYRPSNYINLGAGTITKTERLLDDEDAILKAIGNMPSYDEYLEDGKTVLWYSIKKEGDGWHVDGQIVSK